MLCSSAMLLFPHAKMKNQKKTACDISQAFFWLLLIGTYDKLAGKRK